MIKFNLKKLLDEKDYSITKLHSETGISRNSLTLLANGKSQGVQFETLEKIAIALNVEISDLFIRSFDVLQFQIITKEIKDVNEIPQYESELGKGIRDINRNRFKENELNTLKCRLVIDDKVRIFYFPYRLIVKFNPVPSFDIEIDIKRYDIEKNFQFLYNEFFYLDYLINYYFTNSIMKFEENFIKKMVEEYNLNAYILKFREDLKKERDYQVISLTKKLRTNKKSLNDFIDKFNRNYSYKVTIDDGIILNSK